MVSMDNEVVRHMDFQNGRVFEVVKGDLLAETTDTIINAANSHLAHGAGVALAIARAAGFEMVQEGNNLVRQHGEVPVGEAIITTAGNLPFKGVIHTVGPRMGEGDEQTKLVRALFSSLVKAHEKKWESVSFPGVSSGIFSVPHDICADAYLEAVGMFWETYRDSTVRLIRLVLFKGPLLEEILNRSDGWGENLDQ
jgi:O-acetyl-ADP-ribose deacetylase (regulator of RNase III)